ncbi:hypothetical protein CHLRE_02g081300v5 [Chlamydomonas reinhardtii]|uniref:Nudix hydrolase domain-containing protein n=1 Tax=Chlamydomonas reinhardtii TaxID=3055 RepID=A0A2K3E0I0_CHLRE|nr:uncharacterized protein CHLRE_02g081300v5 [Chlamydomonas reinhardtii]PNW86310.1 hypothetical protein CHLRE_02g081300v5 [Chlamydomonas reinhardtii]
MHALPRAEPPTRALGCLALHTRGGHSTPHWTCSAHALAPPSPSGSPHGRGAASSGPCSSAGPNHTAAPRASTTSAAPLYGAATLTASTASTGVARGVRCWAACGPTAPLSLGAGSVGNGCRACCPGAGPLSSAWPCRCVSGTQLGPGASQPARPRIDQRLTPGAEARGGGGGGGSYSSGGGGNSSIGGVFLASVAASAAVASVGTSGALAEGAALRSTSSQLRLLPSTSQHLRAPARAPPLSCPRPAAAAVAAASASAASGGGTGPSTSPASNPSSASRRSPLVLVGSGSSSSSSSRPAGRAVAAAGPTQMAAFEAAVAPSEASARWPPVSERLDAVAARLRAQPQAQHKPVSDRAAAVLVGLFEDSTGVVRVLLTQRSSRLKSHRGEVCLPGGKRDEEDADDAATALREANEELGLDPSSADVLCCLPPVLSKHHLSVTPVLALLPPGAVPAPHPAEVDAAFTVPLAVFLGTYADPRRTAGGGSGGVGAGGQQQAATSSAQPPAPVDDGGDSTGRRTRRRRSAATAAGDSAAAAAAATDTEPKPLSWRPPSASASKATAAAAAAAGVGVGAREGEGAGAGVAIGSDCAYGNAVHEYRDISWGEHEYRIHSFQYGDFDVWGLTATICIAAARLALGREPSFQERCLGGQHYSCFYWDGSALRVRPEAEIAHADAASAAAATADAAAGPGPAAVAARAGRAGEGGVLQLPSREDLAAAADVAVEAVEAEVVIAASGSA